MVNNAFLSSFACSESGSCCTHCIVQWFYSICYVTVFIFPSHTCTASCNLDLLHTKVFCFALLHVYQLCLMLKKRPGNWCFYMMQLVVVTQVNSSCPVIHCLYTGGKKVVKRIRLSLIHCLHILVGSVYSRTGGWRGAAAVILKSF